METESKSELIGMSEDFDKKIQIVSSDSEINSGNMTGLHRRISGTWTEIVLLMIPASLAPCCFVRLNTVSDHDTKRTDQTCFGSSGFIYITLQKCYQENTARKFIIGITTDKPRNSESTCRIYFLSQPARNIQA